MQRFILRFQRCQKQCSATGVSCVKHLEKAREQGEKMKAREDYTADQFLKDASASPNVSSMLKKHSLDTMRYYLQIGKIKFEVIKGRVCVVPLSHLKRKASLRQRRENG